MNTKYENSARLKDTNHPTTLASDDLKGSHAERLMDESTWRSHAATAPHRDQDNSKHKSSRRILTVMDLVSQREGITAKLIAQKLGISLATCYSLINILIDEGYLERIPRQRGYRLGQTISLLYDRSSSMGLDSTIEPVAKELAERSNKHVYFAVLEENDMEVTQVQTPSKCPAMGVTKGVTGASHALALGKILLATAGSDAVDCYIQSHELDAFTPRTIVQPHVLKVHLDGFSTLGYATDLEEFAENLCCLAVPIKGAGNVIEGALGISTTSRHFRRNANELLNLAQNAAKEASKELQRAKPSLLPPEGSH